MKEMQRDRISRRQFIKTTSAACAALLMTGTLPLPHHGASAATGKDGKGADVIEIKNIKEVLRKHFGDRKIEMAHVKLKVPIIAENGAVVPVTVTSDLPMEKDSYVKRIYIFVDGNFNPYIASAELSPANGKASLSIRIKMRQTSNVRAVAEMNDGRLYGDIKSVKVTIGGCGG